MLVRRAGRKLWIAHWMSNKCCNAEAGSDQHGSEAVEYLCINHCACCLNVKAVSRNLRSVLQTKIPLALELHAQFQGDDLKFGAKIYCVPIHLDGLKEPRKVVAVFQ
jgi:hypothetical protein